MVEVTLRVNESLLNALEILKKRGDSVLKHCKTDADLIESAAICYLATENVTPYLSGSLDAKIPEECTAEELAQMMELGWDLFIADGKMLGWVRSEKE
jgi:hypothetical protein